MIVLVNGTPREIADGATVTTLVESLGWRSRWVVVERNGEPVERARFADVALADGDRLEIVRPVAGGASGGAPARSRDPRRERLARSRLYLCTGGRGGGRALDAFLDAVLEGGVDVVQLRDKDLEAKPLLALAERFRAACDRWDALFVVNDRVDVALAAGADGVHLGQHDLPPATARDMAGPELLIGRSTHAREEITHAAAEPVDYIAVGPVYETPTKPGRPAVGPDLVRFAAAKAPSVPWFAIGGIDESNLDDVAAAGATRIVVVRAIAQAADPGAAARTLRAALA